MSDAEVVYSDVKFTRSNGKTKETVSSSPDTTYSEIKTSKKQPPAEPPVSASSFLYSTPPPAESNRKSTVTCERVALLVLSFLLVAALVALGLMVSDVMTKHHVKDEEIKALKKNISESQCKTPPVVQPICPTTPELNEPCHICEAGWEKHGEQCYYFSTNKSTWNQSRDECRGRGGELVKIDSREEQKFLERRLRDKMTEAEDKFWIGLTDSQTEGTWLWVDGSALTTDTSLIFWAKNEPDNWEGKDPEGEDCVRMGERGGAPDLKCWFDQSCEVHDKSICEKSGKRGKISNICQLEQSKK
ncbi:CD209 antigen-like protein E isoform X2 [Mugil cephalus]|uniref:CD209 antigen-like protein E isoform X2 n=1 Tax=Mugil cephalus TaxID=48193 RepID=UPI001FB5C2B8|nr:CD209 antigen-like protein E isoform X2 [Mugil cephalus]